MVNFNFGLGDNKQTQDGGQQTGATTDDTGATTQQDDGAVAPSAFDPNTQTAPVPEPITQDSPFSGISETPVVNEPEVSPEPQPMEPVASAEPQITETAPAVDTPAEPSQDIFPPVSAPIDPVQTEPVFDQNPATEEPQTAQEEPAEIPPMADMGMEMQPNQVQTPAEPEMPVFGGDIPMTPNEPVEQNIQTEETPTVIETNVNENAPEAFIPAFGNDSQTSDDTSASQGSGGDPLQTLGQIKQQIKSFIEEKQASIKGYENEISELKDEMKDLKEKIKEEEKAIKNKKDEFLKMLKDAHELVNGFDEDPSKK